MEAFTNRTILIQGAGQGTSGQIRLHVVEAGPEDGPLVVLLHGFPEFSYGWRKQIGPLAAAGFRVVAPDQRGYGLSDKPQGLDAYNLDLLAGDVVGLIDALGYNRAHLVGHDWGGNIAWWVGIKHAERLDRLALLNIPHPTVLRRTLRQSAAQKARSSYAAFFQLPGLPELLLRGRSHALLARSLVRSSRPGTFTPEELAVYRAAWARPGALTGMLNWYRAAVRRPPARPASRRVTVPTLLIWGAGDRFLGREMAQPSIEMCDQGRLVFLEEATHWVQHEEPDRVNRLLIEHLTGG
jgi:pimeloyl-ACP methyl ester carboxylesterase